MKMPAEKLIATILFSALLAMSVSAQTKLPPETRNAALRYWIALAQLQDTSDADKGTADLLQKTIAGEADWDEAKLGPIVDENMESIRIMQRATKLPECDWGFEYSLGPNAPIYFLIKSGRALARLNTLYGMRLTAKGEQEGAIAAWLAGIRFSEHFSHGGSLIFLLVARAGLRADVEALTRLANAGRLNDAQRKEIQGVVRALPETVFDWGAAWDLEEAGIERGWEMIRSAKDPRAKYQELMGEAAPAQFMPPTTAELSAFRTFMSEVSGAYRLSPEVARARLSVLSKSEANLNPALQAVIPNFEKTNGVRGEIMEERRKLLQAVAAK